MILDHIKKKESEVNVIANSQFQIRKEFTENTIPDFRFINQFGEEVTQAEFDGRMYVADFFFTTCPTICPAMAGNKIRIQEAFKNNSEVLILSHSIDPRSDSIPKLKSYGEDVGALKGKWHLVTGVREEIYEIAKEYYVTAQEDELAKGSFIHDGSFILVDGERHIRGIYDGTDLGSTEVLINDIKSLLEK
ncbi:SCO family protein [Aquimarina mytili]|uniref:SCO family protein n=1 Tax=Aquimarina mytili TaxID=874423 RepID=A0A937DAH4_9FLAO|nr:SCO family protein [Aquimarina mytili]MBL0684747.1 SCO family protein [Aquimarina mytili]